MTSVKGQRPLSVQGKNSSTGEPKEILPLYLETVALIERLHRRLMDVIKDELNRRGRADVNDVQAMVLFYMGDGELSAGELRSRGYYLGSNVSYNLKKMVDDDFIEHRRSKTDRRSVNLRLTQKGQEVRNLVESLFNKHLLKIEKVGDVKETELAETIDVLKRLHRFWTDQILYRL